MEDSVYRKRDAETLPEVAAVLDHLEEGIIILDADHRIVFRSRKCELQFGLSGTASTLAEIAPTEHLADWQRAVDLALIEGTFCTAVPGVGDGFLRLHINAQTDGKIVVSVRA
ncbi:MAG: PAS domain-containing protein, partial [Pseudomonadota bacterium]